MAVLEFALLKKFFPLAHLIEVDFVSDVYRNRIIINAYSLRFKAFFICALCKVDLSSNASASTKGYTDGLTQSESVVFFLTDQILFLGKFLDYLFDFSFRYLTCRRMSRMSLALQSVSQGSQVMY